MTTEKNIQTVQQVYADFGTQNVEGVLNAMTDDVSWNDGNYPDIPYTKQRTGKKEVMGFFMDLGSTVEFTEFTPQEFYADNDTVIVKGYYAGKGISTGKSFVSDWVQIMKLRGDKIFSYQAFTNTQQLVLLLNKVVCPDTPGR